MVNIFNIYVGQGDCILLQFIKEDILNKEKCKYLNILVDGGFAGKNGYKEVEKALETLNEEFLNGVVATHVDSDHIAGILKLIDYSKLICKKTFVLFNKYDETIISYTQAKNLAKKIKEKFSEELLYKSYAKFYSEEKNAKINEKWDNDKYLMVNLMSFNQRRKTKVLDKEKVNITILWPDKKSINRFMQNWHVNRIDSEITNRSSITLLIEFMDCSILLPGDAYISDFIHRLELIKLAQIDIVKATHHGAKENNVGLVELVKKYECKKVLFTIDEQGRDSHPDISLVEQLFKINCEMSCGVELRDDKLKCFINHKNIVTIGERK